MRIPRAIDRFLGQMVLEDDWTPRTVEDVYRVLAKLADENPEAVLADYDGRSGTERLRVHLGKHYGKLAPSTRGKVISYFHSFFAWAEEEGLVENDPARRIRRPPKRKPDVYKPDQTEIRLLLGAASLIELAPLLMMSGVGLRAAELCQLVWRDVDLLRGRVRVFRKGRDWQWLPIDPLVLDRLRLIYAETAPEPNHHIFVAETEQWITSEHRIRRLIDPATPRTTKTLWRMVLRVSDRASIRPLGPHMLRRGFANSFLKDTRDEFGTADIWTLQYLMGHSRLDTTENYLKELQADEAADVYQRLRSETVSQSQGDEDQWASVPAIPLMEAAGIEPASAETETSPPEGTGSDDKDDPHKRRLSGEQPPREERG